MLVRNGPISIWRTGIIYQDVVLSTNRKPVMSSSGTVATNVQTLNFLDADVARRVANDVMNSFMFCDCCCQPPENTLSTASPLSRITARTTRCLLFDAPVLRSSPSFRIRTIQIRRRR